MTRSSWQPNIPPPNDVRAIVEVIEETLQDGNTPLNLEAYFDPNGSFAGAWFHRFGEHEHGPFDVGCHDVLALNLLDVQVPAMGVRNLLFDPMVRERVSSLLLAIPWDVDLWNATDEELVRANDLWDYLGSGVVVREASQAIRSKMMARKRPRLIPITDSVIGRAFPERGDTDFWSGFREVFRTRGDLVGRIEELRDAISPPCSAPHLRVLDAALWMRFRDLVRQ